MLVGYKGEADIRGALSKLVEYLHICIEVIYCNVLKYWTPENNKFSIVPNGKLFIVRCPEI